MATIINRLTYSTGSAAPEKIVVDDASYLFAGQVPAAAGQFFKIVKPSKMNQMFFNNDVWVDIDMTQLDIEVNPSPVNINNMFYTCTDLISAKLPAGLVASSVAAVFQGCTKVQSIDWNGIIATTARDYRSCINGCQALTEFDGSVFPDLQVANNNCQNFFSTTKSLRKVWIPKEWKVAPTTANYSPFISNGGSNAMNANLTIYTDAVSAADQIAKGKWSQYTTTYNSAGTQIPAGQIVYGATHQQYLDA